LDKIARKLEDLRLKAENKSQLKVLDSLGAIYALNEPQQIPDSILGAFFRLPDQGRNNPVTPSPTHKERDQGYRNRDR
jgi:hypothetical protein